MMGYVYPVCDNKLEQDSWSYHLLEIENPLNKIEKGSLKVILKLTHSCITPPPCQELQAGADLGIL